MNDSPGISFIIPAYNSGAYIDDAVNSIMAQTYERWELIIIDDGSEDDTLDKVMQYAKSDPRIHVIHRERGSGSAFRPRFEGIMTAKNEFILPLDADDIIPPDYARALIAMLPDSNSSEEALSSIVYPAEYMWTPPFDAMKAFRPDYFDERREIICRPGKEAVALTLDGWRVPAAGGIIPRRLYLNAYESYGLDKGSFIHADEILTRYLMYEAETVTFTDRTIYYCRSHPESITTKPGLRRLDILTASQQLIDFTRERFGTDSGEYRLAHRQLFHWIFDSLRLLTHQSISASERSDGYRRIRDSRRLVDVPLIRSCVSKKLLAIFHLPLPLIRFILQFRRSK